MNRIVKMAAAAAVAFVPAQAFAATGNVIFNGTVTHTCTITVGAPGGLGVSGDFQTLSSSISGGAAGSATIAATGNGFEISVDAPTLTKPTADTTSETLTSSYSTSGATSVSGSDSSAANGLNHGNTSVTVNMSAVKGGSDVFEAGTYTGTVVLRCE